MNIEDYKLEILALQKKDTENAINSGFKNKDAWFRFMMNQPQDEIASAIIDIAKRYNVKENVVAYHVDPTMIFRISKLQKDKKMTI